MNTGTLLRNNLIGRRCERAAAGPHGSSAVAFLGRQCLLGDVAPAKAVVPRDWRDGPPFARLLTDLKPTAADPIDSSGMCQIRPSAAMSGGRGEPALMASLNSPVCKSIVWREEWLHQIMPDGQPREEIHGD